MYMYSLSISRLRTISVVFLNRMDVQLLKLHRLWAAFFGLLSFLPHLPRMSESLLDGLRLSTHRGR